MRGGREKTDVAHPSSAAAFESSARDTELSSYEHSCAGDESTGRAVRGVLNRIGDKWSLLVIATLRAGRLRFTELRRHIPGISHRMLTLTLRQLERDGLVVRSVYAEVPPRVEYELTELGRTLVELAIALGDWATAHHPAIEASRAAYDERRAAE
ncbi:helix-turn-helix transcriptional regulator [Planctomonas sp. JC2975]|uniref:winged helix-turn-helix transcriptional regulator n=1 Tax=Planctomonas sp. JC2975 TaxID=2729626 RepID=UPI001472F2D6|nr:helix-turn-helix transcriptional regulator [Planctomonas sp. JC2975]